MRTVFSSHANVAHAWAHGRDEARANNVFCSNGIIYSYGYHFPIARRVNSGLYLFTTRSYSVSTAKHKSIVRSAIPMDAKVFEVDNVLAQTEAEHAQNMASVLAEYDRLIGKSERAWKYKYQWLCHAYELYINAQNYASYAQIECTITQPVTSEQLKQAKTEALEKQRLEQKRKLEKAKEAIEKWKAGENVSVPYTLNQQFLRLKNGFLETSLGVKINLETERKQLENLYLHAKASNTTESTIRPNTYIGEFKYTLIEQGNVTIGCHYITWPEIERIGKMLFN